MKRAIVILVCLFFIVPLFAEAEAQPGSVIEKGIASWYTSDNNESLTANGEIFDPTSLSADRKSVV